MSAPNKSHKSQLKQSYFYGHEQYKSSSVDNWCDCFGALLSIQSVRLLPLSRTVQVISAYKSILKILVNMWKHFA